MVNNENPLEQQDNGVIIIKKSAGHPAFPAIEIRKLRMKTLGMKKDQFCKLIGASKASVDSWECGRRKPTVAHIKLLKILRMGLINAKTLDLL